MKLKKEFESVKKINPFFQMREIVVAMEQAKAAGRPLDDLQTEQIHNACCSLYLHFKVNGFDNHVSQGFENEVTNK